jgi:hypothetical protein
MCHKVRVASGHLRCHVDDMLWQWLVSTDLEDDGSQLLPEYAKLIFQDLLASHLENWNSNIVFILQIKYDRMRWAGHIACLGRKNCIESLGRKIWRKRNHLEDIDIDGRVILRWIFMEGCWLNACLLRTGQCQLCMNVVMNLHLCKAGEFLGYLSIRWLHKRHLAPWS